MEVVSSFSKDEKKRFVVVEEKRSTPGRDNVAGHGRARDPSHVDGPMGPAGCHVDPRGM